MTFREVAIKNFKLNIKKFFSYFLCSSFSIMIFFIYASLLFNEGLKKDHNYDLISMLFYIVLTALTAFSVFFINYAHTAFMKSRNKEFGVYLTLGMNSDDLRKIVNIENIIIIVSSLAAGLVSGMLFSRLFQMITLKLLNINNVKYSLNYKSFALTIAAFAIIFLMVIMLSILETKKLDISDLLKNSKKKEDKVKGGILLGVIGVTILILSVIMLIVICNHEKLRSNTFVVMIYILISFIGAYVTISYMGAAILKLVKNSRYYYQNILSITEIIHKFTQNKRIIFILSILSSMTITLVASPFALYSLSASIAEMDGPKNIQFVQLGNINKLSEAELKDIAKKADTDVKGISSIEFISLELDGDEDKADRLKSKPIVSQNTYNSITGLNVNLKSGEALNIITDWKPGNHGIAPLAKLSFSNGSKSFQFTIANSIHSKWIVGASIYNSSSGIVVSNEDYTNIKNSISTENIGFYKGIIFEDWKKTEGAVDKLVEVLNSKNAKLSNSDKKLSSLFQVLSTIKQYKDLKQGYSFFIFITSVMGFLFFIAGGSVLFFKKYTELNDDKERFFKLYKVGISEEEAVNVVAKELRITFFTPLVMGSLLGYSFIYLLTFMFGGGDIIKKFMTNATFVVAAYFIFQAGFYYITKRKYAGEVMKTLKA